MTNQEQLRKQVETLERWNEELVQTNTRLTIENKVYKEQATKRFWQHQYPVLDVHAPYLYTMVLVFILGLFASMYDKVVDHRCAYFWEQVEPFTVWERNFGVDFQARKEVCRACIDLYTK